jgi:hypothetical protein
MLIPFLRATSIERLSGQCPTCHDPVPAESTINLSAGNFDAKIPSAKGDLQIFPKQTIKTFTGMIRVIALVFC